jgi:uncharacterized protein (UPF0210 family)
MKYTAGPWAIAAGPTYCAIRTDARVIADMRLVGLHYNKADAALIAAAPDLLEALENLLKAVEWSEAKPVHNLTTLGRAMAKAKTAIARTEAA